MHRGIRQTCQDLLRAREIELRQLRENDETDIEERHVGSPAVLKRERNSVGDAAIVRAKARSMRRSDPKPQETAMVSTVSSVSSNRRRARSVRMRSTKSAGLTFKPDRKRRLSERSETPISAARMSVRQSSRGCAEMFSASFSIL